MKILIIGLMLLCAANINAEILIDDFSTGELETNVFSSLERTDLYQIGSMVGGDRLLRLKINSKQDDQNVQVAIINNKLISSFGYNTRGVLKVNYGTNTSGASPMGLNFVQGCQPQCETLNIEFEAKSSVSGVYAALFTNTDRAVWGDHVTDQAGTKRVTIPLSEFEPAGESEGFTLHQVDYIRLQFDSRSIVGHNFAIDRIWVE